MLAEAVQAGVVAPEGAKGLSTRTVPSAATE